MFRLFRSITDEDRSQLKDAVFALMQCQTDDSPILYAREQEKVPAELALKIRNLVEGSVSTERLGFALDSPLYTAPIKLGFERYGRGRVERELEIVIMRMLASGELTIQRYGEHFPKCYMHIIMAAPVELPRQRTAS